MKGEPGGVRVTPAPNRARRGRITRVIGPRSSPGVTGAAAGTPPAFTSSGGRTGPRRPSPGPLGPLRAPDPGTPPPGRGGSASGRRPTEGRSRFPDGTRRLPDTATRAGRRRPAHPARDVNSPERPAGGSGASREASRHLPRRPGRLGRHRASPPTPPPPAPLVPPTAPGSPARGTDTALTPYGQPSSTPVRRRPPRPGTGRGPHGGTRPARRAPRLAAAATHAPPGTSAQLGTPVPRRDGEARPPLASSGQLP